MWVAHMWWVAKRLIEGVRLEMHVTDVMKTIEFTLTRLKWEHYNICLISAIYTLAMSLLWGILSWLDRLQ